MSERFLEEQIRRIRELSAQIVPSERREAELTQLLERTRSAYGPLGEIRDLTPYDSSADDHEPDAREPVRSRRHSRRGHERRSRSVSRRR